MTLPRPPDPVNYPQLDGSVPLIEEEDEEGEEDVISFLLAHFAACKNDPAYRPDGQERRKVRDLLREGYSAAQIAAAIDQAFDAHPANAAPIRSFGFVLAYVHHRLRPTGPITAVLTGDTIPTGESTGSATEGVLSAVGAAHTTQSTDDPMAQVYGLLEAATIQGMEGVADARYDLPGIRLGIRDLLERQAPFSPDEVYSAVLAAVSRNVQPEHLVAYAAAILENARAEARERDHLHQVVDGTVHTRQDGLDSENLRRTCPETPAPSISTRQGAEHPPPDRHALALWQSALRELEMQMTKATFDTWLRPARLLTWEPAGGGPGSSSTRVILGVPNDYVKDWLENRLFTPIRRTLCGIAGHPVEIAFQVDGTQQQMQ